MGKIRKLSSVLKLLLYHILGKSIFNELKLLKIIIFNKIGISYEVTNILRKIINSGDNCIDIGANYGQYTLPFSLIVGNSGRVFSFEPLKENYQYLMKMKKRLHLNNVSTYNIGLSDSYGEKALLVPKISNMIIGTRATFKSKSLLNFDNVISVKVLVNTLDNFIKEEYISHVSVIKCDAEGSEIDILRGARNCVSKYKPILMLELNPDCDELNELYSLGYKSYYVKNNKLIEAKNLQKEFKSSLVIFIHSDRKLNSLLVYK